MRMTLENIYHENDTLDIIAAADSAHKAVICEAEERGLDVEVTVDEGEVYLNWFGEKANEQFEHDAQLIFDEHLSNILS